MRHSGREPFERPMRPDRVDAIRQAAEALAADPTGQDIAKHCNSFDGYLVFLTWNIYEALGELGPDTMVAEIQAGVNEAKSVCRAEYEACLPKG